MVRVGSTRCLQISYRWYVPETVVAPGHMRLPSSTLRKCCVAETGVMVDSDLWDRLYLSVDQELQGKRMPYRWSQGHDSVDELWASARREGPPMVSPTEPLVMHRSRDT